MEVQTELVEQPTSTNPDTVIDPHSILVLDTSQNINAEVEHPNLPTDEMIITPNTVQTPSTVQSPIDQSSPETLLMKIFDSNSRCIVRPRIEPFQLTTGYETETYYNITFENGTKAVAIEESQFISRWCLGAFRSFTIHIGLKHSKQEFLKIVRPISFLPSIQIFDGKTNAFLGKVKQRFSIYERVYIVENDFGRALYEIMAPCLSINSFFIYKPNNRRERLGEIKKRWHAFFKDASTESTNLGIYLPTEANATEKALLFAAMFLLDYQFYSEQNQRE